MPACRERRVGRRHLERGDVGGAEAERRVRVEWAANAHLARRRAHVLGPDVERQPRVGGVVGGERRARDRERAAVAAVVGLRTPRRRRLVVAGRRSGSGLYLNGADRYEVESGLIPRRIASVSTNVLNVEPACRRACEARLYLLPLRREIAVMARMAPFSGLIATSAADGSSVYGSTSRIVALRDSLEATVDGRVDPQAARAHRLRAVRLDQLELHVREEVRLADLLVEPAGLEPEAALADGRVVLRRTDRTRLEHRREHRVPPGERIRRLAERIELRPAPAAGRRAAPPRSASARAAGFEKYVCAAASTP